MGTWGEILKEIQASAAGGKGPVDCDSVRRKYITRLHAKTDRAVIVYATAFTQPQAGKQVSPDMLAINDEDVQGLMEVIHSVDTTKLDLVLHSPGGLIDATEAFVTYLRSKFTDIRVIVPQLAMSAATLISCAANRIVMGKHSFLGPIDPQVFLETPTGRRSVAAEAILEQFEQAKKEASNPAGFAAYVPMLKQYGPDLLVRCEYATTAAKDLASGWLTQYMFAERENPKEEADRIVQWLGTHQEHKSHGRHIPREKLRVRGLVIDNLEDDQELQDLVLSIFHATTHTFSMTRAVKIIENHLGNAFIKMVASAPPTQQIVPIMMGQPSPGIKNVPQPGSPPSAPHALTPE